MARQKITATDAQQVAEAERGEELPPITARELAFVEGMLQNKSALVAYREAFPDSNAAAPSMQVMACRLSNSDKIQQWLAASRKAYLGSAVVTLEGHVRELERLREIALASGNIGAAVQAETHRGKASGLYVERYADVTPPDPVRVLREVSRFAPEVAQQMAARLGVILEEKTLALPSD